jgi:hypothetical protein
MLYAIEAILPCKTILRTLDSLINRAMCIIFGCSSAEDIKYIRSTVALQSNEDNVNNRKAKFFKAFSMSGLAFAGYVVRVCNILD